MGKDSQRAKETGRSNPLEYSRSPFSGTSSSHRRPSFSNVPDLGRCVDTILLAGCAVLFGFTRDGGAASVTILEGDLRHRAYCASDTEISDTLRAAEDHYNAQVITT
jgi:hypothetical protein